MYGMSGLIPASNVVHGTCTPPAQNVDDFTSAAEMTTRACSTAPGELAKSRKHHILALGSFTSGLSAYEFGQNWLLPAEVVRSCNKVAKTAKSREGSTP